MQRLVIDMKLNEINIRDPFILVDDGKYYIYGTAGWGMKGCFPVYESLDLEDWDGPFTAFKPTENFWADRDFWAPEVHKYNGAYYMFASFKSNSRKRGTQILKAESPKGPFLPISDGPVTPEDWSSLDGTLYIEDGVPYIIFCHEWAQTIDGTVEALRLSDDLTHPVGEPFTLWKGSDASWSCQLGERNGYVTDGPFVIKRNGELGIIWSSFTKNPDINYVQAVSFSDNGKIGGKWRVSDNLIFSKDGGHGMVFRDLEGKEKIVLHRPNNPAGAEHPVLLDFSSEEVFNKQ